MIEKITPPMKANVPLNEAINLAGTGLYTSYVVLTCGFLLFAGQLNIQSMSTVLPLAGCDLKLTSAEKGTLNSIIYAGMLFSGPISGFLADVFGRKRVTFIGQATSSILMLLGTMAPNITILMVLYFANGFSLSCAITPIYVIFSEFCPETIHAKGLIICSTIATLANIYLPGMAMLVLPLEINIHLVDSLNLSSWRLFLLILTMNNFAVLFFLWKLPETPKYQLNQGQSESTLELLKTIFAVNQKKKKEDYPVLNVILDSNDEMYAGLAGKSNTLLSSLKQMVSRSSLMFSKPYILYSTISCIMMFSQVGSYCTFILWLPEQLSRITHYSYSNDIYNVTLCDLMSSSNSLTVADCQLNYDFFTYCIILGIIQAFAGVFVGLFADRIGKKLLLVGLLLLAAGMCSLLSFLNMEVATVAALVTMIIADSVSFPLIMAFIMGFYPTYFKTTASAITLIFGRLGVSVGSQLMGLLFENHCHKAYLGISTILMATALLCLLIPSKKNV